MNKKETRNFSGKDLYAFFRKKFLTVLVVGHLLIPDLTVAEQTKNTQLLISPTLVQQIQKVTGVITDPTGEPIIGANVIEKGTTNGTITDLDGRFSLEISTNSTLQISYIGYIAQELVYKGESSLNIILMEDTQTLEEVVVTALGIKRDKKALGYSMQEVKGEGLNETRDANIANALAGKVAGLQISQNGTGAAGSTRIVIRGNNSITGNNQPLIVVDGVPIDNFSGDSDDYWGNGKIDKGSGISDISPDDIESISVLKGPAAAALYGSRAGNGVVMITTKKGTKGQGVGITFNTNLTVDNPMQTPKFQNTYGQGGYDGEKEEILFDANKLGSWGPKMNGEVIDMALGKFAYAARDNDMYKDFIRTGSTWTNSVDISKSSDDITFRASVTRLDNKAIIPNSGFDRTSINLRSTAELASWLSADMKVNYINQHTNNRIKVASDPDNIFYDNLLRPRSVGFSDYQEYKETNWKRPDGRPASYKTTHSASPHNVFWSTERNTNKDKKDRFLGFAALDFTFTDWLSLKLRSGMDTYTFEFENIRATGNPYWEENGNIQLESEKFTEINSDFLLTGKGNWNKFGLVATAGGNIMYRHTNLHKAISGNLVIPDFYAIANGRRHTAEYTKKRKQINSLYATASLSWDDYLYLDLTARNDWSSTLPKDNSSYFYPSVGASWVFTQMLHKMNKSTGPITFGKIRASWAQVGNDTDPYQLRDYYKLDYDIKGGILGVENEDWLANPNLKNETIESWEIGLEMRGFENRVGFDIGYYKKNAYDQILKIAVPAATGYKYKLVNAGNIENRGFEVALNATPVITPKGFAWDTQLNWSKNINKVVSLSEDTDRQILSANSSLSMLQIVAEEGGNYGDIYGYAYQRDDNGNIVIGENGIPIRSNEMKLLGNNQPKWLLGWHNSFSYKNFSLGFLIDMHYGGHVWMGSIATGTRYGNLEMTLPGREGMVVKGVTASGAKNEKSILAQEYWEGINGITEEFIYDATNIRLRELSFGYTVPRSFLLKTPFTGIKASLVGRNLFMIYSQTKGFDPEAGYSNGNVQGVEFGSMPTLRSIGFNINVSF